MSEAEEIYHKYRGKYLQLTAIDEITHRGKGLDELRDYAIELEKEIEFLRCTSMRIREEWIAELKGYAEQLYNYLSSNGTFDFNNDHDIKSAEELREFLDSIK